MELKELRIKKGLTQQKCAEYLGVPIRTYIRYENDENRRRSLKYKYMVEKLDSYGFVDEGHGLLTIEEIRKNCRYVFENYPVDFCYLFGSYAKGTASENSDVDLLVATPLSGLKFYGFVEELRTCLKKKTDVLNMAQLSNNCELVNEILKDGIKIYG